jgi:hypothetical protein
MKQLFVFSLLFLLLSGCSNNPASPFPPILPNPSVPANGTLLLSGFNGLYSLSILNDTVPVFNGIAYKFPTLDAAAAFDTIEISFHYAHFGFYAKTFSIYEGSTDNALIVTIWQDTLTRGERSATVHVRGSWFQYATSINSLSASYPESWEFPKRAFRDSTYLYDMVVIGLKN